MIWPVKSVTGTATQRTSGLNSPSSKAMPLRLISAISRSSTGDVGDRLLGRRLQLDAFEKALQLIGAQRGEDDLAERGAMRRPHHADAVGQLKRAGAAGAGDHDDGVAHSHRKMAAFAGFPRQLLEHRGRDIDHLDFVERAGGQRKQRPADAVALGILFLAQIAQRHHGLGEMEGGGIVQADQLAQFGKPDAFAVTRDLFEDRKGAAERLHADPLPVVGVVVDIGCGGCTSLAIAVLRGAAGFSLVFGLVRAATVNLHASLNSIGARSEPSDARRLDAGNHGRLDLSAMALAGARPWRRRQRLP